VKRDLSAEQLEQKREYDRAYRAAQKEVIAARQRAYFVANKEAVYERQRARHAANKAEMQTNPSHRYHGTLTGYFSYRCRCELCRDLARQYNQYKTKRRAQKES
jgi:hypothetical protein